MTGGGMVKLLRLVRLARLAKLIRKIPPLQVIVMGLVGGLKSIVYIMLLLFIVLHLYGILGMILFYYTTKITQVVPLDEAQPKVEMTNIITVHEDEEDTNKEGNTDVTVDVQATTGENNNSDAKVTV